MKKALLLLAFGAVACGDDFAPKNVVHQIRILAARADLPYARPNETVKIDTLVHDGRLAPGAPMHTYWFPTPCIEPEGGQYWGCFAGLPSAIPTAIEAPQVSVTIPADAFSKSVLIPGQTERFATAYVFVVACSGTLAPAPQRAGLAANQMTIGCVDANGKFVGPDDFVLGFTRIFVFEQRRNTLPVLDGLTFEGAPIDVNAGVTTGTCVRDKAGECNKVKFDVVFNDAVSETDPDNIDQEGKVGRETIYVDWFTTIGKFDSDRRVVFDGNLGRPPKARVEFEPIKEAGKGTIWAVLHDNRGGTTWQSFPIELK